MLGAHLMAGRKFDALKRSQLCLRLHLCERELLGCKPGSSRDRALRAERADLLAALTVKDAEIYKRWEKTVLFGSR